MKLRLFTATLLLALAYLQNSTPPVVPPAPQRGLGTPAPAPLSAAECKCSMDVTVKRQTGGAPISDVAITATFIPLASANTPAAPAAHIVLTAMTDTSGRAVFPNLAEGTYLITAQREGYFGSSLGGTPAPQANATASVGPAPGNVNALIATVASSSSNGVTSAANLIRQPEQHVAISMIQGGIISGRIQNANHRPALGVQVIPYQVAYQFGQRTLRQTANQVQTDDLGQFRLFWFAPGEYFLRITLPPVQAARGGGPNYPSPTYYPGTLDPAKATPILVHEGEEVSGADFELNSGGGVTISGSVTNTLPGRIGPNGQANRSISSLFLVPRNSGVIEMSQAIPNSTAGARGAGTSDTTAFPFEIRGVPPGSYDFYPIFNDGGTPPNIYTGHIPIDVGSENITGIQTAIQPGVDLKLHVSITGTAPSTPANRPAPQFSLQNVRLQIRPADNLPAQLANRSGLSLLSLPEDGVVTITNLPEARFVLTTILGMPIDGYVSEMLQGSRNIMDDGVISVGKATGDPLEITISRGGGTISGSLLDAQRKPLAGGRIFLIPNVPRRRNLLLYKSSTSSAMGTFSIPGVAPGAYKLFSWDAIPPQGAEQSEDFLSRYDTLGTPVIVSTGPPAASIQVLQIKANP